MRPFRTLWIFYFALGLCAETLLAQPKILFLGDSLTEGLGVKAEEAFPEQVKIMLKKDFPQVEILNAGQSGSTSASGSSRLKWLGKKGRFDVLVLSLGANDGLRGIAPLATKDHLQKTIRLAKESGQFKTILLTGMYAPPSMGPAYVKAFNQIFPELATEEKVELMPFLLEGVAADPKLNQKDQIHPNAQGHKKMAAQILPFLQKFLKGAHAQSSKPS